MGTFRETPTSAHDDRELAISNLIQITGIARKTAEALYEIGIHSYPGLIEYVSQHTAEEISAALRAHGVNRSPGLIDTETWITDAEALSRKENAASRPPEAEVEPEKPTEPAAGRGSREHHAVFTVSFDIVKDEDGELVLYTTVYDERNAGKEKVFRGSDTSPWVNWILERANLPLGVEPITPQVEVSGEPPPTAIEAAPPPIPEELPDFQLEISDVKISEIEPTRAFPERRHKTKIDFKLSGPGAETVASQPLLFRTEIYAIDVDSGYPVQVGSREDPLEPHVFEYSYQIEFRMPGVGRYEFHSVIRSLPSGKLRAYLRGPTIRIST